MRLIFRFCHSDHPVLHFFSSLLGYSPAPPTIPRMMEHFRCGLKTILESQMCDGTKDCSNGENEQSFLCNDNNTERLLEIITKNECKSTTNALISVGTLFGFVLLVWVANCAAVYWRSKKIRARTKERARFQSTLEERLGCRRSETVPLRQQPNEFRLALPAPPSTITFSDMLAKELHDTNPFK